MTYTSPSTASATWLVAEREIRMRLRSEKGVEVLEFAAGYALFEVDSPETAQRVLKQALATSPVQRFAPSQPSLATIFKEVIK